MIINWLSLQTYYFSKNIPVILYNTDEPTTVEIKLERVGYDDVVVIEEYEPAKELGIYINIGELIHNELEMVLPMFNVTDCVARNGAFGVVTITPDGVAPKSFYAIKGSLDTEQANFNFLQFFQQNILSVGPQIRYVEGNEPVIYGFFSKDRFEVLASAFKANGTPLSTEQYYSELSQNQLYSLKADFNYVAHKLWPLETDVACIEFIVKSLENPTQTYSMRLVKQEQYEEFSDYFMFENSIGSLETIHLTGQKTEELRHEYLRAKLRTLDEGNHEREYQTIPLTAFEKNTGWIYNEDQRRYILDFLASSMRFHYNDGKFRRIYLLDYESRTTPGQLNSITFTFAYSRQYTGQRPSRSTLNPWGSG